MMTQERLTMRQIREILRLRLECGNGRNAIAKSIGRGKATITDYLKRAKEAGLVSWQVVEPMSDAEIERKLGLEGVPECGGRPRMARPLPDFVHIHKEIRKKGVTLELLWQEYAEGTPDAYRISQFRELYRAWEKKLSPVMRQSHRPGEKAFVDYSGTRLFLTDPRTGEKTPTQLFVGCLGASSYVYAEASLTQTLPHWLLSHVRMLEFFGGSTAVLVPDQLRSGVKDPCRYDPEINPSYHDLATHYGACVIPARPRKPRDKAKAEVSVLVAQRWIVAVLRNRTFSTIPELNAAIRECVDKLNSRIMRHVGKSRKQLWQELDLPALRPLPPTRYEFCEWKKATVNIDYHVELDKHFYSVHHTEIQNEVWVRASAQTVEILKGGVRIAGHPRSYRRGEYTTDPAHRPANHQGHAEWSPERLVAWGRSVAPSVGALIEAILSEKEHPEQGYRHSLGIIRLQKKYGKERLAVAAEKVLLLRSPSYKTLKQMLERRMENAPLPGMRRNPSPGRKPGLPAGGAQTAEQLEFSSLANGFVRGKAYYH